MQGPRTADEAVPRVAVITGKAKTVIFWTDVVQTGALSAEHLLCKIPELSFEVLSPISEVGIFALILRGKAVCPCHKARRETRGGSSSVY
jgi:hypothetical protein